VTLENNYLVVGTSEDEMSSENEGTALKLAFWSYRIW